MSKAIASEVIASPHGLVVIGSRGPGTRLWYLPKQQASASTRLHEFVMPWEPPRESPAALLPSGKLLVVGRDGGSLTLEPGRSPQPGPVIGNAVIEGLSADGVAFARGPTFFRYVEGAWRDEGPAEDDAGLSMDELIRASATSLRSVRACEGDLAVGAQGDVWLGPTWTKVAVKTKAQLNCVSGRWIGGEDVVLERKGKTFKVHEVRGSVSSITAWGPGALLIIDGALFDLKGEPAKAPPQISSISAQDGTLWCVSRGGLFETNDLRRWVRKTLPKR